MSLNIRAAIGEDMARYLEQNGSDLPPHPNMLNLYLLRVVKNPSSKEDAEKELRKRSVSEGSTVSSSTSLHTSIPLIESDYFRVQPESGLHSSYVCAYPNIKPYYLSDHFSLAVGAKNYTVHVFALFETQNQNSYIVEIFKSILFRSLKPRDPQRITSGDVQRGLKSTFCAFRDQLVTLGYNLKKTAAAVSIIISTTFWTMRVGGARAIIASNEAMKKTGFVSESLFSAEDSWSSAEVTLTSLKDIPMGSIGIIGSEGLYSKISAENLCRGVETYMRNHQNPLSKIATDLLHSARTRRDPIQNASVLIFSFQEKDDYVLV